MSLWTRVRDAITGTWMLPAGVEAHCGDECMAAAARYGHEERLRFARLSVSEAHMADSGEWDVAREGAMRTGWEARYPQWPWAFVREHVWRAWAVAGSGDRYDRTLH